MTYIVGRTYGMFSSLFGIGDEYNFSPIAARRNMPMDASSEVLSEHKTSDQSSTWITWKEIQAIDWNETGKHLLSTSQDEITKRADVLTPSWKILFRLMEVLATYYGDSRVRLVVWFRAE